MLLDRSEHGAVLADNLRRCSNTSLIELVMIFTEAALAGQDIQHILHAGVKLLRTKRHVNRLQDVPVVRPVFR